MNNESTIRVGEIEFIPIKPREGLIGFASCVVDGKFYFGGIGIHTMLNGGGLRITYPTRKIGAVNFSLYHPINAKVAKVIEKSITEKVTQLIGEVT